MEKRNPCPVRSEEIFRFALDALEETGVMDIIPGTALQTQADLFAGLLPEMHLPDIYLDLPLSGGSFDGIAAVFDSFDRCYLEYTTNGEYSKRIGVPALTDPGDRDTLLIVREDGPGARYFTRSRKLQETALLGDPALADDEIAQVSVMKKLAKFPAMFMKHPVEGGFRFLVTTGDATAKSNFANKPYKEAMLAFLAECGCGEEILKKMDSLSFYCGLPYWDDVQGYREWIVCTDIAAFSFTVKTNEISNFHAILRISDRPFHLSGQALKPISSTQWHITDNCDQRCRHCYIFAEDAARPCQSTPWDQLIHTLDEITGDAVKRNTYPFPHISGGDPILHPDFWRFAEELHRRGIPWVIMGNPFHLDQDVCRRLYELGCLKYQMSLDGLREFHDSMRKPGSFQATVDAVSILNEAGIESQFMATVSRQNMEDVLLCMDLAAEIKLGTFVFARYCATDPEKAKEAYPSPEEYRDFLYRYYMKEKEFAARNCRTRFGEKDHLFTLLHYELGEFRPSEKSKRHPEKIFDGCHLGQGVAILSNGDVMACRRMESVIGNVRTQSLYKMREGELCEKYRDIRNIRKCKDCELLQWCRGCRATGYNVTGDLQEADPCCWK